MALSNVNGRYLKLSENNAWDERDAVEHGALPQEYSCQLKDILGWGRSSHFPEGGTQSAQGPSAFTKGRAPEHVLLGAWSQFYCFYWSQFYW